MPWKDWTTMLQREEFARLAQGGDVNLSSLCRRFGISRKSGYKWMERFAAGGVEGLRDRSRRPHRSPSRSDDAMERRVLSARQKHPAWGGRKLRRLLLNEGSDSSAVSSSGVPAPSTIGQILLRHGLIDAAESTKHRAFVRFEKEHPNELRQMDFKGHVPMLDGGRCHPLTVLDDHSRYNVGLIACGDRAYRDSEECLDRAAGTLWSAAADPVRQRRALGQLRSRVAHGVERVVDASRDRRVSRPTVPSADAGQRGAFSSHAQGRVAQPPGIA